MSGFPTYDRIVGHVKKDKTGNVKPDQDPSPYDERDVPDFIQANACGVYHGGSHYKDKREGAYHREWDKSYKVKCYSKKDNDWYSDSFNTYPPRQLHCPKVEIAFLWRWLKENHPGIVFDPEAFKECKEQKRAAMKGRQRTESPREVHPSQHPFAAGKAAAQPGPSTAGPATPSAQPQAADTTMGQSSEAPPTKASEAAVCAESSKVPPAKVPETTIPQRRQPQGRRPRRTNPCLSKV